MTEEGNLVMRNRIRALSAWMTVLCVDETGMSTVEYSTDLVYTV